MSLSEHNMHVHDDHTHAHDDPNNGPSDDHAHRDPGGLEEPLDAANQSLADALRASFSILKGIMAVLVVLYIFSNVRSIESSEQALVVRLGELRPEVHEAGLVWAFPFPIDEILPLPTRKSNDLVITSHTFHRDATEIGRSLAFIARGEGQGLHPVLDGSLLTADSGLVHIQWKLTYKIDDVRAYIANIVGDRVESAESLIRTLVETAGIQVAAELTAEEIIRTRVDFVQMEMKRRLNEKLRDLQSGIEVTLVELQEPTPPLQVRHAFDNTQRAENAKQAKIRSAEQERTKRLSEAAGAAYPRFVQVLDEIDAAIRNNDPIDSLAEERNRLLKFEVEGNAGRMIKDADAYLTVQVARMQSDMEMYRTLLPEFERNPRLLIGRLWEETKQQIFQAAGVTKIYRPRGTPMRLHIPLDPEQSRQDEALRLRDQTFDVGKLRPKKMVPLGPEFD